MIFRAMRQGKITTLMLGCLLLLLTGCGGGGGSSGAPASSPAPPPLPISVTPSAVTVTALQGSSTTFDLTLVLDTQVLLDTAHIFLKDPDDVVTSQFDLVSSDGSRTEVIQFHTTPTLTVGDHEGDLGFIVCNSSPCATPYSTTPANVHYKITITPVPPAAVLTPSSINVTVEQGDPATIVIDAVTNSDVSVQGFALDDPQGRFSSTVNYVYKSANDDAVTLNLLAVTDAPGTYSGTVNLRLCNSYNCSDQDNLPGSPISIPYTITVNPFVPLAAIPSVTGLPEWETYQGNAAHTGYAPVTLDSTTFTPKWTWTFTANDGNIHNISPVTSGSNKVVLAVSGYVSPASLVALNESDGSLAWQHDFGVISSASDPAVFGGRVFLVTIGSTESSYLQAFSVTDGSPIFQTSMSSQWAHYLAPPVKNGYVYAAGNNGSMFAFNATTGVEKWSASVNSFDMWTPAVDSNFVYAYTGAQYSGTNDNLTAFNVKDGSTAYGAGKGDFNWDGWSLGMSPVLPGDNSILLVDGIDNFPHQNHLVLYSHDTQQQTILWEVSGAFVSNPVIASETIYVLNSANSQLEARDQTTGNVLWTWQPSNSNETMPIGNLVLTNNLVFLTTSVATYAIDLTTHQAVWSTPHVGSLALSSNKVLYISSPSDQTVYAYTLN